MTKLAPQLSPLCPPRSLFINFGIEIEANKPDKTQYDNINNVLNMFIRAKNKNSIVTAAMTNRDGLISLDIPFQFL